MKSLISREFYFEYGNESTLLFTETIGDFESVKNKLKEDEVAFPTHALRKNKTHAFVLRSLDFQPEPSEIIGEMEQEHKIKVKVVYRLNTRFVEEIDSSLKWYFLVEVLVKSYHITLSLINVINATREDIYFYFTFLIVLLSQVFMYYYNANELSIASTHLSVRIFKSNWYDQSPEVVRSLSIMMMRVQRPLVLTIAGIRVIDIELFVSIIKAGYTFILYQEIGRDS
ncbi:unnamed protein product [Phaedon cochleariae]|uniref:Odorant receptor n=1 Tax=Phaedon cochleariae TaxID=80249 RepID=A0A9N9X4C8_PHACE|nr:unnamed protein product [Phaedon cochleariae]